MVSAKEVAGCECEDDRAAERSESQTAVITVFVNRSSYLREATFVGALTASAGVPRKLPLKSGVPVYLANLISRAMRSTRNGLVKPGSSQCRRTLLNLPSLFGPQSGDWVHMDRAPRGNHTCSQSDECQDRRNGDEGPKIMRTRLVKQRRESAGRENGCQQANCDACPGQSQTMR
jgi:hypothetical protein